MKHGPKRFQLLSTMGYCGEHGKPDFNINNGTMVIRIATAPSATWLTSRGVRPTTSHDSSTASPPADPGMTRPTTTRPQMTSRKTTHRALTCRPTTHRGTPTAAPIAGSSACPTASLAVLPTASLTTPLTTFSRRIKVRPRHQQCLQLPILTSRVKQGSQRLLD